MTRRERAQQNEEMIRHTWFGDHEAFPQLIHEGKPDMLVWRKPGTGIYMVEYWALRNTLIVLGDIGDAVYCWPETISLEWISGLNLDYFASKCTASEHGRGYKSWDPDVALAALQEIQQEAEAPDDIRMLDAFKDYDPTRWVSSMGEWHEYLSRFGHETFGSDFGEYADIGEVIDIRCQGHLVGLKMAFGK